MIHSKKLARVAKDCVACGSCVKVCPRGALAVWQGLYARVEASRCIGCGKCVAACPAGVVSLVTREESADEKALV